MGTFNTDKSNSLEASVRPGAFDIKGQQKELFPFDAFQFSKNATTGEYTIQLKTPWKFKLAGADGSVGGWAITEDELQALADVAGDGSADDVVLSLNAAERRIEIYDNATPTQNLIIAIGYLNGIGSYTADDYGIVVVDGTYHVASGMELTGREYVIKEQGAIVILDEAGNKIVHLGYSEEEADVVLILGYKESTGTLDNPDEGDRRIYVDGDEIGFEEYTGGAWSAVNSVKLGGTDSGGNFIPFLACRGVLNPKAEEESTEYLPDDNFSYFDFEEGFADQNGVAGISGDPVQATTWKKFGNYSLGAESGSGAAILRTDLLTLDSPVSAAL